MATISALAVKLTLNAAGFSPAAVQAASNITNIGNTAVAATSKLRGLNQEAEKSESIFKRVTNAVKENSRALLGIAAGGSVAASIKAAADAEEQLYKHAKTNINATQTLTALLHNLRAAVEGMYASFGQAFIESSGLKDGVIVMTGVFNSFRPIAAGIGAVMGTVAGWFISLAKAIAPVIIAFRVFTGLVGAAFKVLHALMLLGIVRWVAGFLGLRLAALAFQGALMLVKAAQLAATYAAIVFQAVAGPKGWAVLAGAAAVAATAIWGVKEAFNAAEKSAKAANEAEMKAAGIGSIEEIQQQMQELQNGAENADKLKSATTRAAEAAAKLSLAYKEALKPVEDALHQVREQIDTLGMSEAQKKMRETQMAMLRLNREGGVSNILTQDQNDALDWLQTRLEELEVRKQMLSITEELANIEKAAAQEGLTKGQIMLDNLRRMGATQEELATAAQSANRIDATIQAKKDAEDAAKIAAEAKRTVDGISPLDKYKKQIEDITRLSKVGALKPADATRAMNAAGASFLKAVNSGDGFKLESPKALLKGTAEAELAADRAKTPLEKMTEIQRQQLKEAKDTARLAREQLAWDKENGTKVANF